MSLEDNENEKQKSKESLKKNPDSLREKLNAAISSYFFDSSSKDNVCDDAHDTTSLIDIVKDGLEDDLDNSIVAEVSDENNDPYLEDPVDDDCQEDSSIIEDPNSTSNVIYDEKLFSGVFDEIEYQSVEVEVNEEKPIVIPEEDSSHYAQIVKDALKSSPKQVVPTVLESEPPVQKSASTQANQAYVSENTSNPLIKKPEKKAVSLKKQDVLSINSQIDDVVTPSQKKDGRTTIQDGRVQSLNKTMSKPKRPVVADVSLKKEHTISSDAMKKNPITEDLHQKAAEVTLVPEIILLYNEKHVEHDPSSLSIKAHENPDRLIKAMWYLEKSGIFRNEQCTLMGDFEMAGEEDLLRVHDESYVEFVKSYSAAGGGFLGDSTYMTSKSYEVAKLSAGAAMKAGSLVADGKYSYAFVMTRPPGHHASRSKYGGFCLFNNVAILARYLQEKRHAGKIMIIDWDAHAGDGTMDIFYDDPTVMFISLHRDPHGFYPRKGFTKETGDGPGKGYTVNVEMPVSAGDDEYALAFEEVVIPLVKSFSPEFIICSCGFDAYYKEKNIGLSLTSEGFHRMTSMIRSLCPKNFILLMEGGYHDFNGQLCHSVLSALQDMPNPVNDKPEISSYKKNQQQQILMETQAKIADVKKLIPLLN